ncbi:MAG: MATE family efflux transporter [Erysipelotrichaceae bacterium]|nr:MATE family efflux transporter [Erysipelotrichaceae bacterium]MDY5252368.1 MATE family efflux transporter [Erysipelotrichaceae bacterium]
MENIEKTKKMTTQPVAKLINELAVPTIISMLITSIYNMADTFFVAQIKNSSATAAVGVVFALMALIQAIGFFCGHGSGNYMSRMLGAGKVENAKRMAVTGFVLAMILGMCLSCSGLLFIDEFARILGSTPTMMPYTTAYLRYVLLGAPFMCAGLVMNNQLRFQGNAMFAMIGITTGGILNIFLDPLFIFGFNLGVAGAAIATLLSQVISFVILLIGIFKSDSLNYTITLISLNKYYIHQIFKGGLPSLARQGLGSISTAVLNLCTGQFGDAAIAGVSIVTRVMQFCCSVVTGFGQGFQPVCGFNYGARKFERVKEGFWYAVKVGTIFTSIVSVVVFIFAPQIVNSFQGNDQLIVSVGSSSLRFQCISFSFTAFIIMANMMLQVCGKTVNATILAASRQGLFLIPTVIILPIFFGLLGIEVAQMIADIASFIICVPMVKNFLFVISQE